jgi:hypothetical protein
MRKLPGKIDGRLITKEFFPYAVGNEGDINCGNCYRWAYIAYKLYEGVELWSNDAHAFPYQRGRFFDSESPKGEKSLEDLVCNEMCGLGVGDSCAQDVDEFEEFWADNGSFDDRKELDRQIRNFWRRYMRKNAPKNAPKNARNRPS